MAGQTDWGGLAIAGAVIVGGYLLYSSGALNRLVAGIGQPITAAQPLPGGGYCADGGPVNPQTGLCMNGAAPTTIPVANPYPGGQPGAGTCTGQDMMTGQPCACLPPSTSSAMMAYGQMSAYQPSTPTCNCQMCSQGGYGTQSPYGSPYGTQSPYGSPYGTQSPYGSPYGTQSPYGSPYGTSPGLGIGGIGGGLYPPGYPSYPYGPIGANYSPYPQYPYSPLTLGGPTSLYPGISPIGYPSSYPIAVPYGGGFGGLPGLPGGFGGGGGGGGGFGGAPGAPGGGFGTRRAYAGTSDLNGYVGSAIAADAYGLA